MIDVTHFMGLKVGVLGLGKSGTSSAYSLRSGGAQVLAWDDDVTRREAWLLDRRPEFIALSMAESLVDINDKAWQNISVLVLSPGVPVNVAKPHPLVQLAKKLAVPIICDVQLLFYTCVRAKYIGITGTNGKSTTSVLLGHILSSAGVMAEVGGNIGTPVLSLQPMGFGGCYVLELSSFQLDLIPEPSLDMSILLNITEDHIDHHGSLEAYVAAKMQVFKNQSAAGVAIISVDNPITADLYDQLQHEGKIGKLIPISHSVMQESGVSIIDGVLYNNINSAKQQIDLGELKYLPGKHNAENIAASFAAAYMYGVAVDDIITAIKTFTGLKHRMQYVREVGETLYINDSKATNADAAEKALMTFDNIYWIAGGVAKAGGINSLSGLFSKVRHAYLIGAAQQEFSEVLTKHNVPHTLCGDLETAFAEASLAASNVKATVLLSPACASYDQWTSFEHRGDAFCSLALAIEEKIGVAC